MTRQYIVSDIRSSRSCVLNYHLAGSPEFIFFRSVGSLFYGGKPRRFNRSARARIVAGLGTGQDADDRHPRIHLCGMYQLVVRLTC